MKNRYSADILDLCKKHGIKEEEIHQIMIDVLKRNPDDTIWVLSKKLRERIKSMQV